MSDPAATLLPHAPEVIRDLAAALAPGRILVVLSAFGEIAEYAAERIRALRPDGRRVAVTPLASGVERALRCADEGCGCILVCPWAHHHRAIRAIAEAPGMGFGRVVALAAFTCYVPTLCPHCAHPTAAVGRDERRIAEILRIAPENAMARTRGQACRCNGSGVEVERPALFRACVFDDALLARPLVDAAREVEALFAGASAHARLAVAARRARGLRIWSSLDDLRARVLNGMMSLDAAAEAYDCDVRPMCRFVEP